MRRLLSCVICEQAPIGDGDALTQINRLAILACLAGARGDKPSQFLRLHLDLIWIKAGLPPRA